MTNTTNACFYCSRRGRVECACAPAVREARAALAAAEAAAPKDGYGCPTTTPAVLDARHALTTAIEAARPRSAESETRGRVYARTFWKGQ